jgi:hypothetical protein
VIGEKKMSRKKMRNQKRVRYWERKNKVAKDEETERKEEMR